MTSPEPALQPEAALPQPSPSAYSRRPRPMGHPKYLALLWLLNLVAAAFFAVAAVEVTTRMALDAGSESVLSAQQNSFRQALIRYGGMALASLMVQALAALPNLAIVPYLLADVRRTRSTCLKIAASNLMLITAIAVAMLVLERVLYFWPFVSVQRTLL
jgi:hypothetical protein